jgi:integration host factor beta subunit
MTKSEIIDMLYESVPNLNKKQVEFIVNEIFNQITLSLKSNDKVEIRGFGSFKVKHNKEKIARNPKTGEKVIIKAKKTPLFKPGKEIKDTLIKL